MIENTDSEQLERANDRIIELLRKKQPWQPMATAPRDGTVCDLWLTGGGRITDQWWDDEDKTWCGLEEEMFSHWMKAPVEGPS